MVLRSIGWILRVPRGQDYESRRGFNPVQSLGMAAALCGLNCFKPPFTRSCLPIKEARHGSNPIQASSTMWSTVNLTGRQLSRSHGCRVSFSFPSCEIIYVWGTVQRQSLQLGWPRKGTLKFISAVATPVTPSPTNDRQERKRLSEEYGFTQIGEPVPDNVTLKNVIDTLPPEVFEINDFKAWRNVVTSVAAYSLGLFMILKAPWYLLPLVWAWTGTAVTGFFVIGHDCAHKSFSKNKMLEDIVGTLAFLPLIYPYEPWRIKHDRHHAKTNMLGEDTAWHPVLREEYDSMPQFLRPLFDVILGPMRPWLSIGHWIRWHFDLGKFRASEQKKVHISLACVFAFMAIGWPLIIYKTGLIGWIKLWLMPWLGYHFWMSIFTMVHHTAPHIPFKPSESWNAANAQLGGTVHCDYPHWIEVLCHDINVHIPHHISQKIPSYNLRLAQDCLRKFWGTYLNEAKWNWRLMKTIMTKCHIYDGDRNYVAVDDGAEQESKAIGFVRRVMPN